MNKSKRLLELMLTVNRMRRFTVKELAAQFEVSSRTILRDLQELSELGVPLYSEVGPHGGYQVLKERILPPIAFSEDEAFAMFFASHALRHYTDIPFEAESSAGLNKFYHYMPGDVRDRIDQMKNRVDFHTPNRGRDNPYLGELLEAAIGQKVLRIGYDSRNGRAPRDIQPVGIYATGGFWYCPAYCFTRSDFRLFRCDRIYSVDAEAAEASPLHLRDVHLGNWRSFLREKQAQIRCSAELSREGVRNCEAEHWTSPAIHLREDGTGWLEGDISMSDIPYFAKFFIGLGSEAKVKEPEELLDSMRRLLAELKAHYE